MTESKKIKFPALLMQVSATLAISFSSVLTGFAFAWPSYTLENFVSNKTVLSNPMSSIEVSMLGSLPNIGGVIATPFTEYAINTFGRKYAAMLFGLPFLLSWTIISVTTSVPLVITSVAISGFGAAGQAVSSAFISEISLDSIRGGLSSFMVTGFFVGLLASYGLGGYLSYHALLYTILSMCVLYIVALMLLKESPVFLVQKGKDEEAAKSLAFYRRIDAKSKEVEMEIYKIKLQLDPRLEQILEKGNDPELSEELLGIKPIKQEKTESSWKFLMKSEPSKRALRTSLFLMISNTLMGAIVFQVYAEPVFQAAAPSMPSNLCSILLAVTFLLSAVTCALIVDKFGRKFLMTSTSIGSGVCTALIGTQLLTCFAPNWFIAVLIYAFCYVNYLGAATVPFIYMAEVFLPEVRGLGISLTWASYFFTNFIELMVFYPLVKAIGLGTIFYGFAAACFLTALYSHFCMVETKGLSACQIQKLFTNKKNSESSKRALTTALILMTANIMMGAIVLEVYAEPMFKEAVPTMPSNLCTIFLATDLMISSLICALTVDKFGRKVRAFCHSIVMTSVCISNFVTLMIFNPLVDIYGLGPVFYGFTVICFMTAVYSHLCLPETKGLSADVIQLLFLKKKPKKNMRIKA